MARAENLTLQHQWSLADHPWLRSVTVNPSRSRRVATRLRTRAGTDRSSTGPAGVVVKPSLPLTLPRQFSGGKLVGLVLETSELTASRSTICGTTSTDGTPRGRGPRPRPQARSTDQMTAPPSLRSFLPGYTRPTGTIHPSPVCLDAAVIAAAGAPELQSSVTARNAFPDRSRLDALVQITRWSSDACLHSGRGASGSEGGRRETQVR